ncbi:MAG: DUF3787 domain-containing protein [Peptoniphilus sp.]|nr:DUF3787 domain-containing protein [Peptoniphilus sp.]MDD7363500.1 DUF3787 domain-containing protein [Bacillota bacterium]MDY6044796.1 DUF3787 domain-containing protein [Peptoniphilus sp.]
MVDKKDKRVEKAQSRRQQENQNEAKSPASDIYGEVEGKDPETRVEVPTDEAVEKSMEWINENAK